jgi:hypothetical protein
MPDLDFVTVVGRFGITAADNADAGDDPEIIWCDAGDITLEPLIAEAKVAGGSPVPWTGGQASYVPTIDAAGFLSWRGRHLIKVIDLTSTTVNPRIISGKATHKVTFRNVKSGNLAVTFTTRDVRLAADTAEPLSPAAAAAYDLPEGTLVCDLTKLLPVPVANSVPIVVGQTGKGITSLDIDGTELVYELTDGTVGNAGELPVGPGGSDVGVAGYLDDEDSDTRAVLDPLVTAKVQEGVDDFGVTKPGPSIADYAVASRRSAEADGYTWTTKEETVARALGWTIVTDPRWAGGAKMDGVTDDTAAFAAAVANGGTIWIPQGTLLVTAKTVAAVAYTSIRGAGKRASVLKTNTDAEILEVTGNYSTVQAVMFQNTLVGRTKFALKFTDTNQGEVFGCYFGSVDGGRVWGVWFKDGSMGLVDGCTFSHAQIRIETWDTKVTRSWVWGMSCDYAIGIFGGAGNTALSNVDIVPPLLGTATGLAGIYIDGASGKSFNTSLTDIYLDGNPSLVTRRGIYIGEGTGSVLLNGLKANKLDAEAIVIDSAFSVTINGYIGQGNNQSGNGSPEIKILQTGTQPTENIRIMGASFLQTAAVTGTAGPAIEVDAAVAADQVTIDPFDVKQPAAGGGYSVPEIKVPVVSNYPTQSMVGRGKLTKYRGLGSVAVAAGDAGKTIAFSDSFGFPMAYRPRPSQIQLTMESAGQTLPAYRITYTNDNQIYVAFAAALTAAGTLHWRVDLRR